MRKSFFVVSLVIFQQGPPSPGSAPSSPEPMVEAHMMEGQVNHLSFSWRLEFSLLGLRSFYRGQKVFITLSRSLHFNQPSLACWSINHQAGTSSSSSTSAPSSATSAKPDKPIFTLKQMSMIGKTFHRWGNTQLASTHRGTDDNGMWFVIMLMFQPSACVLSAWSKWEQNTIRSFSKSFQSRSPQMSVVW